MNENNDPGNAASNADGAGGSTGGLLPVEQAGVDSNASGAAAQAKEQTRSSAKPVETLFGKLLDDNRGDLPACTCGKLPGTGGQHKGTCPRRASNLKHGAAPVLPAVAVAPGAVAGVVPGQSAPAFVNHSVYGEGLRRFVSRGCKTVDKWEAKRAHPVLAQAKEQGFTKYVSQIAALLADEQTTEEDLDELAERMTECAKLQQWAAVNPVWSVALILADIALGKFLRSLTMNTVLADAGKAFKAARVEKATEERK